MARNMIARGRAGMPRRFGPGRLPSAAPRFADGVGGGRGGGSGTQRDANAAATSQRRYFTGGPARRYFGRRGA